jgi:hypothetical protein
MPMVMCELRVDDRQERRNFATPYFRATITAIEMPDWTAL